MIKRKLCLAWLARVLFVSGLAGILSSTLAWGASYWNPWLAVRRSGHRLFCLQSGVLSVSDVMAYTGGEPPAQNTSPVVNRGAWGFRSWRTGWWPASPWFRLEPRLRIRLPLWLPLLAFLSLTTLSGWAIQRQRRRERVGLCSRCGYNLTGNVSGVCPECGEKI